MKKQIISNIIQSVIEKFLIIGTQFLLSFFLVRMLEREDYGIIGVVSGYFVFVNFVNISLESVMLRDHKKYEDNPEKYFMNFFLFNFCKTGLFIIIAAILSFYLVGHFKDINFLYAVLSATFILIADSIVAPLVIYSTSKFNQKTVTKIASIRSILNIIFVFGLLFSPTLAYNALKDFIVGIVFIIVWFLYSRKKLNYKQLLNRKNIDLSFIKINLFNYSIWTHLNGVITNFIYKSDTFFLSFFVSLKIVGDYNVALMSANVANILPMIFGYQNSVALSHATDDEHAFKISNTFIRLSIYLGLLTIGGFLIFGQLYLKIITGQSDVNTIYLYMIFIVLGLVIVKTIASPLNSFINIRGSVISLFKTVLVPTFLSTLVIYYFTSRYFGAMGISIGNLVVALLWLILMIKEVKRYNYNFKSIFRFKDDLNLLKGFIKNGARKGSKTY
ncbi:polysaccharide biosynthesis protein [Neobacillus bataviensis LMG 21833]|uniref:Polysaccharide biosynthesis protein n=1 Tax=Neobacillus bataviensis LMG 21833 TaxID=1117379 RepID=K6DDR9_9BACI|nr:oligosaccharide flippase family protein [Neobacillus bataviensis]EKN66454.1 polysaccharide biosynthesis protein [Neobacillus bataviensis LMG 21833]